MEGEKKKCVCLPNQLSLTIKAINKAKIKKKKVNKQIIKSIKALQSKSLARTNTYKVLTLDEEKVGRANE